MPGNRHQIGAGFDFQFFQFALDPMPGRDDAIRVRMGFLGGMSRALAKAHDVERRRAGIDSTPRPGPFIRLVGWRFRENLRFSGFERQRFLE